MARKAMQGIAKWPQKAMNMARKGYAHGQKSYAEHRKMARKGYALARKGYAGHSQIARKVMQGIGKWPEKLCRA
jgi:hypothetical protein